MGAEPLELAIEPGTPPRAIARDIEQAGVRVDSRILFAWFRLSGKVREIKDLLAHLGMTPVSVAEFDLEEPEETEDTFVGNALIKAHAAAEGTGMVSLADDSGLMVDALDGDPGVYTANWAELPDGTRDWDMAMQKVEDALAALGPDAPGAPSGRHP